VPREGEPDTPGTPGGSLVCQTLPPPPGLLRMCPWTTLGRTLTWHWVLTGTLLPLTCRPRPPQSPAVQVASAVATGVAAAATAVAATAVAGAVAGAGLVRDKVPWDAILAASPVAGWGGSGHQYPGAHQGVRPGAWQGAGGSRIWHTLSSSSLTGKGTMGLELGWTVDQLAAGRQCRYAGVTPSPDSSAPAVAAQRCQRLPEQANQYPPNLTSLRVWGPQGHTASPTSPMP